MIVCRSPLILGIDLAGAAAAGLLMALVMLCILMPLKRDLDALPSTREELAAAHGRRAQLAARNEEAEVALRSREEWLQDQAAQPLADVGTFLAHMSEQCERYGVTLQQVRPLATRRDDEYQSWDVQVQASGSFPDFARLLHSIESRSPYVQIEKVLVTGPPGTIGGECKLEWTVRVNSLTAGILPAEPRP